MRVVRGLFSILLEVLRGLSKIHLVLAILVEYGITVGVGYGFAFALSQALSPFFANVLFGVNDPGFPISFQMFMWLPFFIGLHELFKRYLDFSESKTYFDEGLLSKNADQIYTSKDLAKIMRAIAPVVDKPTALLPKLVQQIVFKFQANKSIEEATNTLKHFVEIFEKNLDLFYSRLRYLSWLIPTLGFIGTVYGISGTVAVVGGSDPNDPQLLQVVATNLAVAFDTTLLALVQSSILLYLMNVIESAEEKNINNIYQYTFENLINRLDPYEQKAKPGN